MEQSSLLLEKVTGAQFVETEGSLTSSQRPADAKHLKDKLRWGSTISFQHFQPGTLLITYEI